MTSSTKIERSPSVAMDSLGKFVVSWTQGASGAGDVMARRYNSVGTPLSNAFAVANSSKDEDSSHVAMDAKGDFVVTYAVYNGALQQYDVEAELYTLFGIFIVPKTIDVATTYANEFSPSVAMVPDGRFDVAYKICGLLLQHEWRHRHAYSATGSDALERDHLEAGEERARAEHRDGRRRERGGRVRVVSTPRARIPTTSGPRLTSGGVLGSTRSPSRCSTTTTRPRRWLSATWEAPSSWQPSKPPPTARNSTLRYR